ncbi:hypothetical protein KL907_003315 [Ogataea polymorpha]|nr:hypothetical protein KL907_003315 [Ogataea polymorpha]
MRTSENYRRDDAKSRLVSTAELVYNCKSKRPVNRKFLSLKSITPLQRMDIREQDRWLPIANVGRVMRQALPPHGKLSKEAKQCMQECVSEFISFITSQAAEKCSLEKRKTLNGEDILFSMYSLGFENYAETLKIYLAKYRQYELLESEARREKYRQRKGPAVEADDDNGSDAEGDEERGGDAEGDFLNYENELGFEGW